MSWTFERVFYGSKTGFNLKAIAEFLTQGYCFIPYTFFEGYYKAVYAVGDHNSIYARITKPFPDVLIAQDPQKRFALHLSGGYDSAVLAKLYDRDDADYIHFTGPETAKAQALAAMLKGTLHEIQLTPELFIETADEMVHRLAEPYAFEDVVYAYIASRKAKELGHTLIVSGDAGGPVWGGVSYTPGPYCRKALIAWKTLEPDRLLGLDTLLPYMHTALYAWGNTTTRREEPGVDKPSARDYCRQLGMPEIVAVQKKSPWAGSLGERTNEKIVAHMNGVVEASDYNWIRQFQFLAGVQDGLLFRQYSLVRWLEANWKPRLGQQEMRDVRQKVREFNDAAEREWLAVQRKERVRRLIPPAALAIARKAKRRWMYTRPAAEE